MSPHSFDFSKSFTLSPACPEEPLPFAIDEMDFSAWFNTLGNVDELNKCTKILHVLQSLNNAYPANLSQIPGRTRLFFLEKLGSALDSSTGLLTQFPVSNDKPADAHSNRQETLKSNISVWSNLELGSAYLLLGQEDSFQNAEYYSIHEKTLIITNGIQALGKALLYIMQTYSVPNLSYWHQCYQLYWLAQAHQLTESNFNPEASLIDTAFKRILVFALSNTNQFSPQEMRTIYELLGYYSAYASLLKSVPKKRFQGIPLVNLKGNLPPRISETEIPASDSSYLYIATVNVASKILEATYDRRSHHMPIDRLMLMRLAKTLTLNKQRKDPRSTAKGDQLGLMGFPYLIEFINEREEAKETASGNGRLLNSTQPGESRNLALELSSLEKQQEAAGGDDFDFEKATTHAFQVIEFTDPSSIWQTEESGDAQNLGANMRLLDKSQKGFGLLWTDTNIKPKVGNIIGILHQSLTIGLVRWLAQSKETGMFMGVEILGNQATTVKVSNPGYPDNQVFAIYLPAGESIKQYASLIFVNHKDFQPSEFIFLNKNHKNIRYRQTKQLHLTAFVNHIEIVRSY